MSWGGLVSGLLVVLLLAAVGGLMFVTILTEPRMYP